MSTKLHCTASENTVVFRCMAARLELDAYKSAVGDNSLDRNIYRITGFKQIYIGDFMPSLQWGLNIEFWVMTPCWLVIYMPFGWACLLRSLWKIAKSDCQLHYVCLFFRPHGATRLPFDGFSWSFICDDSSKICRSSLVKIWQ